MTQNDNIPRGSLSALKEDSENSTELNGKQQRQNSMKKKLRSAMMNNDRSNIAEKTSHESIIEVESNGRNRRRKKRTRSATENDDESKKKKHTSSQSILETNSFKKNWHISMGEGQTSRKRTHSDMKNDHESKNDRQMIENNFKRGKSRGKWKTSEPKETHPVIFKEQNIDTDSDCSVVEKTPENTSITSGSTSISLSSDDSKEGNNNEYSFLSAGEDIQDDRVLPNESSSNISNHQTDLVEVDIFKKREKFEWSSTPWSSVNAVLEFMKTEGFSRYDKKLLNIGEKMYFRCCKVPKRNDIWCQKRYIMFLPVDSDAVLLLDNCKEHDHDIIFTKKKAKVSVEMVNLLMGLYASKTTNYESVISHINRARETQSIFEDEPNPTYRQHEYQLRKFRDSEVNSVVSIGDIATFCDANSNFPLNADEKFVLNWETSGIEDEMHFRFSITTPYLLDLFADCTTICIDATYKLNWLGFPLVVVGTVDRTKRFHPFVYGCMSNETTDDYVFMFNSIKEGIKKYSGKDFNVNTLIADGADAIRNAFYQVFPNAILDVMCFAHVIRNIKKRSFCSKSNKGLIVEDIHYLQLASNREEFDKMSALFLTKWKKVEKDFTQYFKNEWLTAHSNWFEGAANYTPSTNNALESHNSYIKRNWTFRRRLPMNQFFVALNEMTEAASKKLSSGDRKILNEPKIPKKMWKKGIEIAVNNFKPFKAKTKDGQAEIIFLIPSDSCTNSTKQYYKEIQKRQWKSFDEYIEKGFNQFYFVHLSQSSWNTESYCTCPSFFKQNICKHIIATAIYEKTIEIPRTLNPKLLSKKKSGRGRRPNALKALVIQ